MQQMTSEICAAVYTPSGTETVVPTATLTDTRDQKTYEVAKLADGNCWMIQNLDLDLSTSTELTPANTNISSAWTPANSTIAFTGTSVSGWSNNNNVPYSADPGELYIYSSGTTNKDDQYTSLADCQAEHPDCSMKNHAGNYYNWSAAVASNDTSGSTTQYTNMADSICPAGWGLPDGPKNAETLYNTEMGDLVGSYKNMVGDLYIGCGGSCGYYNYLEGGFNTIRTAPLWLARSGYVNYGSLNDAAIFGYYWYSTVDDSRSAYKLNFYSSSVNQAGSDNRFYGLSVRCVAQ